MERRPGGRRWPAAALAAALALGSAGPARASVTCHCFRERAFDPAAPWKQDTYLLATLQNTFLAAAYGVPKRAVVRAKMDGTPGEDLWVALFAGRRLSRPYAQLLEARESGRAWREILGGGEAPAPLGDRVLDALAAGAAGERLAAAAAASALVEHAGADPGGMDGLLERGAAPRELVAAALFGRWTGAPAPRLFEEARALLVSWGSRLRRLGLAADDLEGPVAALLDRSGPASR